MGRKILLTKDGKRSAAPFLKWAGGKGQLLPELLARVPGEFATYHEPMVGGGALFFALAAEGRLRRARLSDVNPELVNVWRSLRDEPSAVIERLEALAGTLTEEDFYRIRAQRTAELTTVERAARFIYLNKTCFNGLYRENSKGIFNVPFGRYKNPRVLDRENLERVSATLGGVAIDEQPFAAILDHAQPGDFVYFDPPYHPLSTSSSFTAYSKGGFGEEGQRALAMVFATLARRGVKVLLSNSFTLLTRKLYDQKGLRLEVVAANRAINSKADGRGEVKEILVSGKHPAP